MNNHIPKRGDIVWLDFDPSKGSEQKGRRPAIIISEQAFNRFGICYVVPITTQIKGYRIEVLLSQSFVSGVALTNQLTALDWRHRNCEYIEEVDQQALEQISSRLRTLLSL